MLPDMSGQSRSLFCHSEKRSDEESLPSPYSVISPPCEGARNSYLLQPRSFPKSFHSGFISLINAIFFSRRQLLICFSRAIALRTYWNCSKQTNRFTPYFFVNPSISPNLCSTVRRSRSLVMPT